MHPTLRGEMPFTCAAPQSRITAVPTSHKFYGAGVPGDFVGGPRAYGTINKINLINLRGFESLRVQTLIPFRTAVLFWGQTSQIISALSPKRDCSPKRVEHRLFLA